MHRVHRENLDTGRYVHRIASLFFLALLCGIGALRARADEAAPKERSGFVRVQEGVKIHYIEAGKERVLPSAEVGNPLPAGTTPTKGNVALTGPTASPTILFIPGWTMPAWIWQKQIDALSRRFRVVAIDPRSQGESTMTTQGLEPETRARDIHEVILKLHLAPVVIVAWSMAVTETLSYIDQFGTSGVVGFVFVDNDAGGFSAEEMAAHRAIIDGIRANREQQTVGFVRYVLFKKPQPDDFVLKLIAASERVPTESAIRDLEAMYKADYNAVLPRIDKPVIVCAASGPDAARLTAMQRKIPHAQLELFEGDGHALFLDDPEKFNVLVEEFATDFQ